MAEKKLTRGVVALSSAAVLAIYGAGFARTREAAQRFDQQSAERRPHTPAGRREAARSASGTPISPPGAIEPERTAITPATIAAEPAKPPDNVSSPPAAVPVRPQPAPANEPASGSAPAADGEPIPYAAEPAQAPTTQAAATPPVGPPPSVAAPEEPALPTYKDGTYYGWGTSRHGDIQAEVVIEQGRITVARVEKCMTRWSCNWVSPIPPVVLRKQAATYDYVSGATESSDAFQGAVTEALLQAR